MPDRRPYSPLICLIAVCARDIIIYEYADCEGSSAHRYPAKEFALKSLYYANAFEMKHKEPYTGIIHPKTHLAVALIWLEEFEEANTILQELMATIHHPPYSKVQLEVLNAYAFLCVFPPF